MFLKGGKNAGIRTAGCTAKIIRSIRHADHLKMDGRKTKKRGSIVLCDEVKPVLMAPRG